MQDGRSPWAEAEEQRRGFWERPLLCGESGLVLPQVFDDAAAFDAFDGLHDVEIAMRIAGDAMTGAELGIAPLRQTFAVRG